MKPMTRVPDVLSGCYRPPRHEAHPLSSRASERREPSDAVASPIDPIVRLPTKSAVGSLRCMAEVSLRVTSVTIGSPDPRAHAEFYARLLGRPVTSSEGPRPGYPPEDGWAQVRPIGGTGEPTLNFEYEQQWSLFDPAGHPFCLFT